MKRAVPGRGPRIVAREEIDLRSKATDARRDPGATAKISREELETVLQRSISGTRAAVRPEESETRTRSGERLAVRPGSPPAETGPEDATGKTASDRPTARPAAIEVGAPNESESDRIADELYRAVANAPSSAQVPRAETPEDLAPLAPLHERVLSPLERRRRATRMALILLATTTLLAVGAYHAGLYLGALFGK